MPCDLDATLDALARALDLVQAEDPASSMKKADIKPNNLATAVPGLAAETHGVAA
jgi:hypothetical protein